MIVQPIGSIFWPILSSILFYVWLFVLFVLTFFLKKLFRYYGWRLPKIKIAVNGEILILGVFSLEAIMISNIPQMNVFIWFDKAWLFFDSGTKFFYGRWLFIASSLVSIFLPFLSIVIFERLNFIFQKRTYKMTIISVTILSAFILSYKISNMHAGNFLRFPQVRLSSQEDKFYRLIWKDANEMYLYDCESRGKIKGYRDGKEFFSSYVDYEMHSNVCTDYWGQ